MRVPAVFLVLLLAVVGSPSEGRAEKVKTNQTTKLLSRPGERGKVILTVKEGQGMTVVAKDGRWYKVRVSGRTGWVPRSKVNASDQIVRNTRRRSFVDGRGTRRGFGGEEGPEDRVGADAIGEGAEPVTDDDPDEGDEPEARRAGGKGGKGSKGRDPDEEEEDPDAVVVDDEEPEEQRLTARVKAKTVALEEPDEDAEELFDATPRMILYPTGNKQGKYTEVETDDGDLGYVLTSSLEMDDPGGPRGRQIDARARVGVTFLTKRSNPGNGKLATSAATFALGGALLYPYKAKFVVGGEATYDYAKAFPGIRNPDGMGSTSIGLHNLRLRALGGYDLKKPSGMTLFGRLGFHYQSYQIGNVNDLTKNQSKLPSEILTMPALGAGISIPRLTSKIGVRASLDAILFASVKQTKNLEDGASPAARGALFAVGLTYRWRKDLDIVATYDLTYLSMSFGAPVPTSMRDPLPMGAEASRGDQFHAFTVGVAKGF